MVTNLSPPNTHGSNHLPGGLDPISMISAAGNISSDVNLAVSATTKIMDTASLAVGVWLLTFSGYVTAAGNSTLAIAMAVDTATATFAGQTSTQVFLSATVTTLAYTISAIVTVTAAGTIQLQAANGSASTVPIAKATANSGGYTQSTGYTALRIA